MFYMCTLWLYNAAFVYVWGISCISIGVSFKLSLEKDSRHCSSLVSVRSLCPVASPSVGPKVLPLLHQEFLLSLTNRHELPLSGDSVELHKILQQY